MIKVLFTVSLSFLLTSSWAQLSLPKVFADRMVLQRDASVRFWGQSAPEEKITVSVDGFEASTRADKSGGWELLYPPHEAGGPYRVTVSADTSLVFEDVYFGDVWVASGQSNMEWKLGWNVDGAQAEIANGDYPQIRFFEVEKVIALDPQQDLAKGEWTVASPGTVADFSAVAWFFARKNHLEKRVPVGIISSSWGGTPAEAWTSVERLLEVSGYKQAAAEMLDEGIDWAKRKLENEQREALKWQLIEDQESFLALGVHKPGYDDSGWEEVDLPNSEPLSDFVWVRKEVNLKASQAIRLYLGEITQICHVFFNGEMVSQETWQDTTGVVSIPANLAKKGTNLIAIRVVNSWDNKVWIGRKGDMWLEVSGKHVTLEGPWKFNNSLEPKMPDVEFFNWRPGVIYNQMIHPIAGFSMQGVIWYQGESNADKPQFYNELFETMIEDWRIRWRQGNFPFLYVQLANFMERKHKPLQSNWAELREAQTQTLELPKTGMATIIDIGEANDIHPRNKLDVGNRLWLAARKVAFNEPMIYSGPQYESHHVTGSKVTITFNQAGAGLEPKTGPVKGFAIAGEDEKFVWAEARVVDDQIEVWSSDVDQPKYVRYAWADNPEVNLYNSEGLPAVPFRIALFLD